MKIVQGFFGLIILFYLCYTPIYVIFFNSAEDAVEDLSLLSNSQSFIKLESEYGRNLSREEAKSFLNELDELKKTYKKRGIDIGKSAYALLKANKNVKDLKIVDYARKEFGAMGALFAKQQAGAEQYMITWKMDGEEFALPVMVIPPSFFEMRRALAYTPNERLLRSLYGV